MEFRFNLSNLSQSAETEIHSAGAKTNRLKTHLKKEQGELAKVSNEIYENTAEIGKLMFYVSSNVRGTGIPNEPIRGLLAKSEKLIEKNLKLCDNLQGLMRKYKPTKSASSSVMRDYLNASLSEVKTHFLRIKSSTQHMRKLVG